MSKNYDEQKIVDYYLQYPDGGDAYSIRLANQRDFLAVTNYMYENATIYLTRKYNKYQAAVQDLYSR